MTTQDTENQAGGAEPTEATIGIVGGENSVDGGSAVTTEGNDLAATAGESSADTAVAAEGGAAGEAGATASTADAASPTSTSQESAEAVAQSESTPGSDGLNDAGEVAAQNVEAAHSASIVEKVESEVGHALHEAGEKLEELGDKLVHAAEGDSVNA